MFFSRHKKTQRDREAGLVFCWRAGYGGNRGGMLIALLMASGLFAFAFWGLSLTFEKSVPESRKFAKIMLLDSASPELALWIDQNSPFPARWDPRFDDDHQSRVQSALDDVFTDLDTPLSPWRQMPEISRPMQLPKIIERGEVDLGGLPKPISSDAKRGVLELIVSLSAKDSLNKRIPKSVTPLDMAIPAQEYGTNIRFIVSINKEGEVEYCSPVDWQSSDYARNIENWVRLQKFLPSEKAEVGEVSVQVEVKKHAGN